MLEKNIFKRKSPEPEPEQETQAPKGKRKEMQEAEEFSQGKLQKTIEKVDKALESEQEQELGSQTLYNELNELWTEHDRLLGSAKPKDKKLLEQVESQITAVQDKLAEAAEPALKGVSDTIDELKEKRLASEDTVVLRERAEYLEQVEKDLKGLTSPELIDEELEKAGPGELIQSLAEQSYHIVTEKDKKEIEKDLEFYQNIQEDAAEKMGQANREIDKIQGLRKKKRKQEEHKIPELRAKAKNFQRLAEQAEPNIEYQQALLQDREKIEELVKIGAISEKELGQAKGSFDKAVEELDKMIPEKIKNQAQKDAAEIQKELEKMVASSKGDLRAKFLKKTLEQIDKGLDKIFMYDPENSSETKEKILKGAKLAFKVGGAAAAILLVTNFMHGEGGVEEAEAEVEVEVDLQQETPGNNGWETVTAETERDKKPEVEIAKVQPEQAIETVQGPDNTVWDLIENQLGKRAENWEELDDIEKTYAIDYFKDKIAEDSEGLIGVKNIDIVQPGQEIDFSKVFEEDEVKKAVAEAKGLTIEERKNIEKNTKTLEQYRKEHPKERLSSEKVEEILRGETEEVSETGKAIEEKIHEIKAGDYTKYRNVADVSDSKVKGEEEQQIIAFGDRGGVIRTDNSVKILNAEDDFKDPSHPDVLFVQTKDNRHEAVIITPDLTVEQFIGSNKENLQTRPSERFEIAKETDNKFYLRETTEKQEEDKLIQELKQKDKADWDKKAERIEMRKDFAEKHGLLKASWLLDRGQRKAIKEFDPDKPETLIPETASAIEKIEIYNQVATQPVRLSFGGKITTITSLIEGISKGEIKTQEELKSNLIDLDNSLKILKQSNNAKDVNNCVKQLVQETSDDKDKIKALQFKKLGEKNLKIEKTAQALNKLGLVSQTETEELITEQA